MAAELEGERAREAVLLDALEDIVTELEGPAIDAAVLAQLTGDQVELVRGVVQGGVAIDLGLDDDFFGDLEAEDEEAVDPATELEAEIKRLQEAIEESRTRQAALQAYLDALASL